MAGKALASSQLDGCYGPFRMSASTWTFKEKKNKTSTKADPAFVRSSLYFLAIRLSSLLRFTSFGYEI